MTTLPLSDPNAPLLDENHKVFVKGALEAIWKECEKTQWAGIEYRNKVMGDYNFNFMPSSESSGSGCCGIMPIMNMRYIYPHNKDTTYETDWPAFRKQIKELFHGIHLIEEGFRKYPNRRASKIFSVSMTSAHLHNRPYMYELLDFLEFELVSVFRNATTWNNVGVFQRCWDNGLHSFETIVPPEDNTAAIKSFKNILKRTAIKDTMKKESK